MKKIKLECKTGGFGFGDTVEVGAGKDQIDLKTAKSLVAEKLATEVKETVNAKAKAEADAKAKAEASKK